MHQRRCCMSRVKLPPRFAVSVGTAALAMLLALATLPALAGADSGESSLFSSGPVVSAQQHAAYDVVHRYEQLLNAGDTAGIVDLFAPDGVAEWNDKPTFATRDEKITAYDALF